VPNVVPKSRILNTSCAYAKDSENTVSRQKGTYAIPEMMDNVNVGLHTILYHLLVISLDSQHETLRPRMHQSDHISVC